MRRARAEDHWRHVLKRNYARALDTARVEGVVNISDEEISFSPGLTVICGQNGTGKSTILRCIYACLKLYWLEQQLAFSQKTALAKCRVIITSQDSGKNSYEIDFSSRALSPAERPDWVYYLEPSSDAPKLMVLYQTTPDLLEILDTVDGRSLSQEVCKELSYAVGRKYDSIEVFEIEDWSEFLVVPYFKVRSGNQQYSSENMGLGEFSLFLIHWWVSRLERTGILLLEEPESFVSPRSQLALMDLLAKYIDIQELCVVIATHSPSIVSRTPNSNLRVLISDGVSSKAVSPENDLLAVRLLGMTNLRRGIVFVEDQAAQALLECVLEERRPRLLGDFVVVRRGSYTDVLTTLNSIPREGHPFVFGGILDGDQRKENHSSDWPLGLLPSDEAPDKLLITGAYGDRNGFATLLGGPEDEVFAAMDAHQGADEHDWAGEVAQYLGLDTYDVIRTLARCWVRDPANAGECEDVVELVTDLGKG